MVARSTFIAKYPASDRETVNTKSQPATIEVHFTKIETTLHFFSLAAHVPINFDKFDLSKRQKRTIFIAPPFRRRKKPKQKKIKCLNSNIRGRDSSVAATVAVVHRRTIILE